MVHSSPSAFPKTRPAQFDETLPADLDRRNLLTVGVLDQEGEETSFSSFGPSVDVYANGFEVEVDRVRPLEAGDAASVPTTPRSLRQGKRLAKFDS